MTISEQRSIKLGGVLELANIVVSISEFFGKGCLASRPRIPAPGLVTSVIFRVRTGVI